jgi:hypothetical protein
MPEKAILKCVLLENAAVISFHYILCRACLEAGLFGIMHDHYMMTKIKVKLFSKKLLYKSENGGILFFVARKY